MTVKFVSAKSKVVFNKGLSIPRKELLSCLLLSKLVSTVVNAMLVEVAVSKTVFWTDSSLCGGSKELIRYGRFGWKIELEKLEKRLTVIVGGIFQGN